MAPLFLLPLFLSSFHGALAATPLYQAGNAHFSTHNDSSSNPSSNSSSTFWLSDGGTLTFGFKSLGPNRYLLCIWVTADTNRTPLWWPSITNPSVTQGATLNFTSNGNLELLDANQSMLWSTSTSNASFAKLQNTGNLQLFDETMENLQWQSFADLRDTLVVRPRDDSSTSSLSSIVVDKSYLLRSQPNDSSYGPPGRFHLATDENMNVYLHALDSASNVDFIYMYAHMNVAETFFELTRDGGRTYLDNSSMPMSMLRLDPDGNPRIYAWNASHSTWLKVWQFLDNQCFLGSPCGAYGICKEDTNGSPTCTCPVGYEPVDTQLLSRGCYNSLNLSSLCGNHTSNGSLTMVPNQQSDYNYNDLINQEVTDIDECKKLCLQECDCVVASYRLHDKTCFLKGNQTTRLLMNGYATNNNTLLMKLFVHHPKGGVERWPVIVAVIGALFVAMLVVIATIMWRSKTTTRDHGYVIVVGDGAPIRFTYDQLIVATQNFSELLGEGGFGKVYKGRIILVMGNEKKASEKQLPVAVKVLKDTMGASHGEAERQFRAEVSTLGKIHHVNLVDLVGYSIGGGGRAPGKKILVYEYIENGSVARFISREPNPLPWAVRYSIAVGTARGIAYLHHDCKPHILHCDIKPENVLLDRGFTPKVADFGLARQLEEVKSNLHMSGARGTRGYIAPEWLKTVKITSKADVYSYGMVLLKLVRGFHERGSDDETLVDWAYKFISGAQEGDHIDGSISNGEEEDEEEEEEEEDTVHREEHPQGQIHEHDLDNIGIPNREVNSVQSDKHAENLEKIRVLKIGLWCVQYQPESRPSMLQILQLFEGIGDYIGIPPYPAPNEVFVGYQSSSISTNRASYIAESDVIYSAR